MTEWLCFLQAVFIKNMPAVNRSLNYFKYYTVTFFIIFSSLSGSQTEKAGAIKIVRNARCETLPPYYLYLPFPILPIKTRDWSESGFYFSYSPDHSVFNAVCGNLWVWTHSDNLMKVYGWRHKQEFSLTVWPEKKERGLWKA